MKNLYAVSFLLFTVIKYVSAQSGILDPDFGPNTSVATDFFESTDEAYSVVIQPDGKILAAGYSFDASSRYFTVCRYKTDGTLDSSFSDDGKITINLSGDELATSLALQADNKIVVGGGGLDGSSDFVLARFNEDGSNDNTFSGDGVLTTNIGSTLEADQVNSIAIQTDQKIVAVGYTDNGSDNDFSVARYNSDGTLDSSFSGDGKVTFDFNVDDDFAYSGLIQSDGKIIICGAAKETNSNIALCRLKIDGSLDSTFGALGKVTTNVHLKDVAYSAALQTDGKIIVAGSNDSFDSIKCLIMRYNSTGTLDSSFGTNGIVLLNVVQGPEQLRSVQIQPDGKIVAAGYYGKVSDQNFLIVRFNTDGTLDALFGQNGIVINDFMDDADRLYAIALQNDGRIVVAGSTVGDFDEDFGIIRLKADGSSDYFIKDGKLTLNYFPGQNNHFIQLLVQPDDKIISIGQTYNNDSYFAVARCLPDGILDPSFGGTGKMEYAFSGQVDAGYCGALQSDGKIILGGTGYNLSKFILARLNPDASVDSSFGSNGFVADDFGQDQAHPTGMAIQQDGKILIACTSYLGTSPSMTIARFNINGTIDSTFDQDGKATICNTSCRATSLYIQTDGRILIGGNTYTGLFNNPIDFALLRLFGDGTIDSSFGSDGLVMTDISSSIYSEQINDFKILPDGKIICVGSSCLSVCVGVIIMYNSDGSIDSSFGSNGLVLLSEADSTFILTTVLVQADGKIIVGGSVDSINNLNDNFLIQRYFANGTIDQSFGNQGFTSVDFNGYDDRISSSAFQSDGKIVAGGYTGHTNSTGEFGIVRYLNEMPLSANEISTSFHQLKIFPDPAGVYCIIQFSLLPDPSAILQVRSIEGTLMLQTKITSSSTKIDVASWNSGVYLLIVQDAFEKKTLKLIKQ